MIHSCNTLLFTVDTYPINIIHNNRQIEVASFRLPTHRDIQTLNSKHSDLFTGEAIPNIPNTQMTLEYIKMSLVNWIWNKPITIDNISNLRPDILATISDTILKVTNEWKNNIQTYMDNIDIHIGLLEDEQNAKNYKEILQSPIMIRKICTNCLQYDTCPNKATSLKMIPVTSRIIKYAYKHINESSSPEYPLNGSWEDQPLWFTTLLDGALNKISNMRRKAQSK